jgi:protein KTI12
MKAAAENPEAVKLGFSKIVIVNEESVENSNLRRDTYASSQLEKSLRGLIKGAVERYVDPETLVIADYMNSIKGFRYELYCRARSLKTLHCVVQCKTSGAVCKQWNSARANEDLRYTDDQ